MRKILLATIIIVSSTSLLLAKGAGTMGGLSLLGAPSARAASMAEAYSVVKNDIASMAYNPGSLATLNMGQASFMYEKGSFEDTLGRFMIGGKTPKGHIGLSLGYYSAGTIALYDGTNERNVEAQQDITFAASYAKPIGKFSVGVTGKYITSELIEEYRANAFAADFGVNYQATRRLNVGGAIQNFGTQIKYDQEGDDLPRIARLGLGISLFKGLFPTMLTFDVPYYIVQQEAIPSLGLDVSFGVLSMRGGYRSSSDLQEFSLGTGVEFQRFSLDYSFGFVQELDAQHRFSLATRFGGVANSVNQPELVKKPVYQRKHTLGGSEKIQSKKYTTTTYKKPSKFKKSAKAKRQVYTVKPGDSLAKIAKKKYGHSSQWRTIYHANKHLLDDPSDVKVGMKIIIPK